MNPAKHIAISDSPSTPLVNLFAYIRDLFTTTQPELRFDAGSDAISWPLAHFRRLALAQSDTDLFSCQWEDPSRPLLSLRRGENLAPPAIPGALAGWVEIRQSPGKTPELHRIARRSASFEDLPERVQAYRTFFDRAHGQPLEAVADLSVPQLLDAWIRLDVAEGKLQISRLSEAEEAFEANELRTELALAFERSLRRQGEESGHQHEINEAYDRLHNLFYTLKAHPDRQVCLSFGLVSGRIGGEVYRNFLFHIPLKLSLKQQSLSLEADTLAHVITCEQAFTELLEKHFLGESEEKIRERKLTVLREVDQFNTQSREFCFEPDYLRGTFYETALRILGIFPEVSDRFFDKEGLHVALPPFEDKGAIVFSFSPVIHVRPLASGAHIARDADNIIARINQLGTQGFNGHIPDFFKKLFSLRKPGNPLRIAYRVEDKAIGAPALSAAVPERLLFPLPFNEEQRSIAAQLLRQDAVTVQGPPGTGKSHTIANLASHFVAQGKSILIVSKNAKALEVIKEKLPPAIRNLAVALLEGTQNQEELKHAIDAIKHHLSAQYDPADIDRLEEEMAELERQSAALQEEIFGQIAAHQRNLTIYDPRAGKEITGTAAFWAGRRETQELIADPIAYDRETADWALKLLELTRRAAGTDRSLAGSLLPPETMIDALDAGESLLEESERIVQRLDLTPYRDIDPATIDDAWLKETAAALESLATLAPYARVMQHPRFDMEELMAVWESAGDICRQIEAAQRDLLQVKVDVGEWAGGEPDERLEDLRALLAKFNEKGRLPLLKQQLLPARQRSFLTATVNGRKVQGPADLAWVEKSLVLAADCKQLGILMDNYLGRLGLPGKGEDAAAIYREWEQVGQLLRRLEVVNTGLRARKLPLLSPGAPDLAEKRALIEGLPAFRRYHAIGEAWEALIAPLLPFAQGHAPVRQLVGAWRSRDRYAIAAAREAIGALRETVAGANALTALEEEMTALLPETVARILDGSGGEWTEPAIESAIFSQKLTAFLEECLQQLGKPNERLAELQGLRKQTEALTCRLIAEKTWQHKQASVTDAQRTALSAWRNDLINIGKGHGKNTERNMQSAVANMHLAREVVPIWIMQQHTAISFFPDPEPGQFDLLIVDEASQCDISMLNLIFRCKKCIVVGDENQTSVATQAQLFPIARTNQLLDRYLVNHPFKQQFNINNRSTSIYTLSGVIYPNIISLREHFRCRPELIGFSNRYVYDSHIVPLRTVSQSPLGGAMEVHYIEDDPENAKKPAIVQAVVQLVAGLIEDVNAGHLPAMPTLGILCLESSNEAHRELLIRELGRHPLIKAQADALRLLVGTSREFQGDERDVMLLTTTASHAFAENGKIRAPRAVLGEEMMRIYNVAASRARDKAILLHSIHPEALARMNPECFRKRLIDYFELHSQPGAAQPATANAQMHPRTGDTGRALFAWAVAQGWASDLHPQYKTGPYEIDLAILREGKKIALFIDGEGTPDPEAIRRSIGHQLILERAGWTCMRIQAMDWQLRREGVEEMLRGV